MSGETTKVRIEEDDSTLAWLSSLLGPDAFLVPCEWGTKKPLVTYVERPFEGN